MPSRYKSLATTTIRTRPASNIVIESPQRMKTGLLELVELFVEFF